MTTVKNWLAGSFFLGWLIKLYEIDLMQNSYLYKLFDTISETTINVLRGSLLFAWLVADVPGSEAACYKSSALFSFSNRIKQLFVKFLWRVGDFARPALRGSIAWKKPIRFIGVLAFFFMAASIGLNEVRGRNLAVIIIIGFLGLAATLIRPNREWFTNSVFIKFLGWWNGYGPSHQSSDVAYQIDTEKDLSATWRPVTDYTLFLVVAYAVIDFVLRTYSPMAFLAGAWDELLFIAIVIIWITRIGIQKLNPHGTCLLVPFLIYLCIFVFLYLINSPERSQAIEGVRVYLEYVLWFFVGANLLFSKSQFRWLCDVFLLIVFVVALYGIYQHNVGVEIPNTWIDSKFETSLKTRVFSIIGSPNILGSLLVLAMPMALVNVIQNTKYFKKLIYSLVFLVMVICLIFTYSRGAWIASGLAIVLLGLWLNKRLILGLLLAVVLVPMVVPTVYDRMTYMTTSEYRQSSERGGRIGRWAQAVDYWRTSPAIGVGLGRYGGAVAKRYNPTDSKYTDNFYLKTGTEAGLVGLLAFLMLVLVGLRLARSGLDRISDSYLKAIGMALLAGLVSVLAQNAVENVFEVPMMATYFWFFLGIVTTLTHLKEDSLKQ